MLASGLLYLSLIMFVQRGHSTILRAVSLTLVMSLTFGQTSDLARAAVSMSGPWNSQQEVDLNEILQADYESQTNLYQSNTNDDLLQVALADVDHRVTEDFRVPEAIRPIVRFWLQIYTQYTTRHVVVLDKLHPDLVYEVLDFRPLAQTARNSVAFEILKNRRIEATLKHYQTAFSRLLKNPRPSHPSIYERRILQAIRKHPHKHPMAMFAKNVHTQTGQRDNVMRGLRIADEYLPMMEQIFIESGVPHQLTRLSMVESSFNVNAVSKVGAKGVWQFMPDTAQHYLKLDTKRQFDERLSPIKSTVAAAELLKSNRRSLGSWALAITAYHSGYRGLIGLRKLDADDLPYRRLFSGGCKNATHLGWAGRNYFPSFLALVHAEAYREVFYNLAQPLPMKPVTLEYAPGKKSALVLSIERGLDIQEFKKLNPDVQNLLVTLPKGTRLAFPSRKSGTQDFTPALSMGQPHSPRRATLQ
jgi:membrane-bound lytic murein transglycosylase D